MKVLMVTPSFFPKIGGVEKHVLEVAKILENKVDLEILVISKNNKYQTNKFLTKTKISRWNSINFSFVNILYIPIKVFLNTKKILKNDVIHVNDFLLFFYFILPIYPLLKLFNIKLITTFHGWEGDFLPKKRNIILRKIVQLLSSKSFIVGEFIRKWYKTGPSPINIYGGVSKKKIKLKKENLLLFIGRLEEDTGCKFILKLLMEFHRKNENYKSYFLGDGSLKESLKLEVNKNNIKSIHFKGNVNDVDKYLKKSNIVFSSGYLGILEALSWGCHVISTYNNELKKDYLMGFNKINDNILSIFDETNSDNKISIERMIKTKINKKGIEISNKNNWTRVTDIFIKYYK